MAMSGLIQGSVTQYTNKFRSFLYWQVVNSQDDRINRNVSRVRIIPLIDTTSSYQNWDGTCFNCVLNINGSNKTYSNFNSSSYSGWTYTINNSPTGRYAENILEQVGYYYEIDVAHDSDGTKNCNISCSFNLSSGGWGPGNVNVSGTINLDTIPRASKITSDSNLVIGNNLIVNISRYSDQFKHTLYLYFDGYDNPFKTATNVDTSVTFVMSSTDITELYSLTQNAKEIGLKIIINTYKDNTLIGTNYKSGKLIVNESINRPIFSEFTFEPVDAYTTNLTNWESAISSDNGCSIAAITKYKITCNKATALNQSQISKYEVELNGKFYTSTSNVIVLSNPIVSIDFLKVSAYDSRGFKTTISKKITPILYKTPNVKSVSVSRTNSSTALISIVTEISKTSILNNEFWAKYRYKLETSSEWNDWSILSSQVDNNTYTISTLISNLSSLSTFNFEIKIGDSITTQNFTTTLLKIIPELEIKDGQVLINNIDIMQKNIAIAYYENNKTLSSEYIIPNFDKVDIIGDKLSFSSGKIYIGKKVKKIKVNASCFLENINSSNITYIWFFITKNGESICNSITSGVSQYYQSVVISDYIIDVNEGDYLSLKFNNPQYSSHSPIVRNGKKNTRLYVEVIS